MRLFFALTFDPLTKREISCYRDLVADHAAKGRFTSEGNFHVTLEFIGETPAAQLAILTPILHQLSGCPEFVTVRHLGAFSRKEKALVWLAVERDKALIALQKQLAKLLSNAGYSPEQRRYTPHITLGRNIIMREPLNDLVIPPAELTIHSLALMESKREGERLVYQPVAEIVVN
ncbi:RNA 2',3'-cyclic phosphodiesterase [Vibrio sp.]|uniref:RNA 2',3'-cyclic phosphodiesterase n=1 Tax=Vibrio sp. TaxID=678 RepID=UPI003D09E9EB